MKYIVPYTVISKAIDITVNSVFNMLCIMGQNTFKNAYNHGVKCSTKTKLYSRSCHPDNSTTDTNVKVQRQHLQNVFFFFLLFLLQST